MSDNIPGSTWWGIGLSLGGIGILVLPGLYTFVALPWELFLCVLEVAPWYQTLNWIAVIFNYSASHNISIWKSYQKSLVHCRSSWRPLFAKLMMISDSLMAFMSSSVIRKWLLLDMKNEASERNVWLFKMLRGNWPKQLLGEHFTHLPRKTTFLGQAVVNILHEERDGVVAILTLCDLNLTFQ